MKDSTDFKLLERRLDDLIQQSIYGGYVTATDFMTLAESAYGQAYLKGQPIHYKAWGGFHDCERCRLYIWQEEWSDPIASAPIVALLIEPGSARFSGPIGHRDCLGALMGLGIERRTIGDLIRVNEGFILFCLPTMADYICDNMLSAGKTQVTVRFVDDPERYMAKRQFKTYKTTVASLRSDSVVKACIKKSRGDALQMIRAGNVFINGLMVSKASQSVNEGDIISVRGYGKYRLTQIGQRTKKDRLFIEFDQFD